MNPEAMRSAMEDWLHLRFPDARQVAVPPLQRAQEGGSSDTFFLEPTISDNGREQRMHWVLRAQATDFQVYEDPSVERQYRVMQRLGNLGAALVPQVLWYEPNVAVIGTPFFVMERVEGRVPPEYFQGTGVFAEADAASREAMWLSAVEQLARIHLTRVDDFGFLGRADGVASGLDDEIAVWDSYMRWSGAPIRPIQERVRVWLEDHLPADRPTGLAWGDARPTNMVFHNNRCAAVIDWETTSLGGAETDLGWWLFNDWKVTDGIGHSRLPGMGGRADVLSVWEGHVGRRAQSMEWHEMFATWRYSLIADRARGLMRAAGTDKHLPQRSLPAERLEALISA